MTEDIEQYCNLLAGLLQMCRRVEHPQRFTLFAELDDSLAGKIHSNTETVSALQAIKEIQKQLLELEIDLTKYKENAALHYALAIAFAAIDEPYRRKIDDGLKVKEQTSLIPDHQTPSVIVRQEAVGHGGFHHGVMGINEPSFRWIFDCGAAKQTPLADRIDHLAARAIRSLPNSGAPKGKIDILFVSHFDEDHVSGLEMLFDRMEVDTAVVSYLSNSLMFSIVARAICIGKCDPQFIELVTEPIKYFKKRGVRKIVRVKSIPDESSETEPSPYRVPPAGDVPPKPGPDSSEPRYSAHFIDNAASPTRGKIRDNSGNIVLNSGSVTYVADDRDGSLTDWFFLLYAHEWSADLAATRKRAKIIVGVELDAPRFAKELAKKLKAMVAKHGGLHAEAVKKKFFGSKNSNDISLSIYSGPAANRGTDRKDIGHQVANVVGWLLTGDSRLTDQKDTSRRSKRVDLWLEAFKPVKNRVGHVMIPHHGAKDFFSKKIFNSSVNAKYFLTANKDDQVEFKSAKKRYPQYLKNISSIKEKRDRGRPAINVWSAFIEEKKDPYYIVNEEHENEIVQASSSLNVMGNDMEARTRLLNEYWMRVLRW